MMVTRPPICRLMVIDREIRSGRHPTAPALARMLEVSTRTVQRDLEFLRDSLKGPVWWNPIEGGYEYTESTFVLPMQQVSEGDLLAVLVADKALSEYKGTPFEGRLKSIFEKLAPMLPEEIEVSPEELARAYSFRWTAPVRADSSIFRTLEAAIRAGQTLEVVYHTQSRGETRKRKLDPYHLANVDGEWYLLAYCHVHEEVRVFRPSRIQSAKPTDDTFAVPADFDPGQFLQTKFHAMGGEPPVSIRIRFDRSLAGYISEREWNPAGRLQYLTDGGVELSLTTENVDAVVRWVLQWGAGAEILAPPWVRRRVRDLLRRLGESYAPEAKKARTRVRKAGRAKGKSGGEGEGKDKG